ncbi:putative ascorbate-specific transmembrane electron transporter 1 [Acorus calamus]|uniref:Ascorbate-specific transmembrane electron transporter 1 n=1 Tax=Acorus calamus TaxID=4465 RepID=A0AAV9EPY1_ACOCL|nr:putative ascorbate-specific transmembrane electron transporter 1 [Acorus calamus]
MAVIDGGKFRISTTPVTIVAHLLGLLVLILTLIWLLHFEGGVSMTKTASASYGDRIRIGWRRREAKFLDMESIHSWIGMATVCLFGLQWLVGFVSFWFPGAPMTIRARIMPWHVFSGIVIFVMAIISTETGIMEEFCFAGLSRERKAYLINFTGVAVLLFGITVGLTAILP